MIKKIKITNFQGVEFFEGELHSETNILEGRNATGKTGIANAITWLFTGKNLIGNNKFWFLKQGKDACACEIKLDNLILKKIYTKKDNKYTYFINNIETPAEEFKTRINNNLNLNLNYINPLNFLTEDWSSKRKIIIDCFQNEIEKEINILLKRPEYSFLQDTDINFYIDQLKKQIKQIKENIKEYNIKIQENKKLIEYNKENITENSESENEIITQEKIKELQLEKQTIIEKINEIIKKQERLNYLKIKKTELKEKWQKIVQEIKSLKENICPLCKQKVQNNNLIKEKKKEKENIEKEGIELKNKIEKLENSFNDNDLIQLNNRKDEIIRLLEKKELNKNQKSFNNIIIKNLNEYEKAIQNLQKEFDILNKNLILVEEFNSKKIDLIKNIINKKFKYIEIDFWEHLKNGEIKENCIIKVKTNNHFIPVESANTSGKILAALELNKKIIKNRFIILDNIESILNIPSDLIKGINTLFLKVSDCDLILNNENSFNLFKL